jgi:pimeloyl-ACP methyl ester carboxylesterase
VLEGVGHFPHVEAPTAVTDILESFIASTVSQQNLTGLRC